MLLPRRKLLLGSAALVGAGFVRRSLHATVANGSELHAALAQAGPDSTILLAPGHYGDIAPAMLDQPGLRLMAQATHRAVLHVPLEARGDGVCIEGLATDCDVHLAAAGQTITNQRFAGSGVKLLGPSPEVGFCDFASYRGTGIDVRAGAKGAFVHDNTLHDCAAGAKSAIAVGASMKDTNTVIGAQIIGNTMSNCRGGDTETICFKSSGNVAERNKFINCNNFSQRHGGGNRIIGNHLEGSKSINIQDSDTLVQANTVIAPYDGPGGIQVMAGSGPWHTTTQSHHPQAYRTRVVDHDCPLWIGRQYPGHSFPALDTVVLNHRGPVRLDFHQGTVGVSQSTPSALRRRRA